MNLAEKIIAIIGITQIFKFYGAPSVLLPIVAMGLGAMFQYIEYPAVNGILEGFILGASVSGGFYIVKSVGKSVFGRGKKDPFSELEADDDRGV